MIQLEQLPMQRGGVPMRYARGHFATNHSHINCYVDITFQKTRLSEAKSVAKELVTRFSTTTLVDTVLCLDGTAVIGTVKGDLHDIGKNLVKMMLEGKGLEVVDLGTDVSPETFVQTAKEQNCQIICCSALLTTTMTVMADVVKAAEAAGIRDQVKIMIGGAPITDAFCQQIGADAYTPDAASAADKAVEFCK